MVKPQARGSRDVDVPAYFVELVALLTTDFLIAGIGAFRDDLARCVSVFKVKFKLTLGTEQKNGL